MLKRFFNKIWRKLFPRVTNYTIEKKAREQMQAFSIETHPKEAFGVLVGKREGATLVITEVVYQPFSNTTHSANIIIDPYSIDGMVGTFHSHPIPDDRASKVDYALFSKRPGIHFIVPYPYQTVTAYSHGGDLLGRHSLN